MIVELKNRFHLAKFANFVNFVMSKINACMVRMGESLKVSKVSLQKFNNIEQVRMAQACDEGTMKVCVLSRMTPIFTRKQPVVAPIYHRHTPDSIVSRLSLVSLIWSSEV